MFQTPYSFLVFPGAGNTGDFLVFYCNSNNLFVMLLVNSFCCVAVNLVEVRITIVPKTL